MESSLLRGTTCPLVFRLFLEPAVGLGGSCAGGDGDVGCGGEAKGKSIEVTALR